MRGADEIAKVEITPRSLKKIFSSETRNSILLLNQMAPQRQICFDLLRITPISVDFRGYLRGH